MSKRLYERGIPPTPSPPGFAPGSPHGADELAPTEASGISILSHRGEVRSPSKAQDQFRLQMAAALQASGRGKEHPMHSASYDPIADRPQFVGAHELPKLHRMSLGAGPGNTTHVSKHTTAFNFYEHKQQAARDAVDPNYGYQGAVVAPWLKANEEDKVSSNAASEFLRPQPQAGQTQNITWATVTSGSQGIVSGIPRESSSTTHMQPKASVALAGRATGQIDVVTNFSLNPNRIAIGKAVFSHGCDISLVTDSDGGKPAFLLHFLAVGGVATVDLVRFTKTHTILAEEVKSITFFRAQTSESGRSRTYVTIRARPTAQNGLIDYWMKDLYSPDQPGSGASNFIVFEIEHEYDGGHRINAIFDAVRRLPSFSKSFGQHRPDISLQDLGKSIGIDFKLGPISAFVRQDDIVQRGTGPILAMPVNKILIGRRVLSKTPRKELCQVSFIHGEGLPRLKISYQKKDKLKTSELWHNSIAAVYWTKEALLDPAESFNYIIFKVNPSERGETSSGDGGKGDSTFVLVEICDQANYNALVGALADDPWISQVCHPDASVRDILDVSQD